MARRKEGLIGGIAVVVVGAALIAAGVVLAQAPPRESDVDIHGQEIMGPRTVLVGTVREHMSAPGKPLYTMLLEGDMPSAETTATVISDENCGPDRAGVSHCTNRMKLADGSMMTVEHRHRMSEVPCLAPGEMVRVRAA